MDKLRRWGAFVVVASTLFVSLSSAALVHWLEHQRNTTVALNLTVVLGSGTYYLGETLMSALGQRVTFIPTKCSLPGRLTVMDSEYASILAVVETYLSFVPCGEKEHFVVGYYAGKTLQCPVVMRNRAVVTANWHEVLNSTMLTTDTCRIVTARPA